MHIQTIRLFCCGFSSIYLLVVCVCAWNCLPVMFNISNKNSNNIIERIVKYFSLIISNWIQMFPYFHAINLATITHKEVVSNKKKNDFTGWIHRLTSKHIDDLKTVSLQCSGESILFTEIINLIILLPAHGFSLFNKYTCVCVPLSTDKTNEIEYKSDCLAKMSKQIKCGKKD